VDVVLVSGLVTGMLYAAAGLGLVVVYRTTKVLNFAIGGIGATAAYAASDALGWGLPYWAAIVVSILVGALAGALVELLVARPLTKRPHLTVGLGTLGALLVIEGLLGLRYGYSPDSISQAFTGGGIDLGVLIVSANQLFILAVGVAAAIGLVLVLRKTRWGLAMRAVSSGPATAELLGVRGGRVRFSAWALGGAFGGLSAVLVTPLTYLSPSSYTTFLLTAFAAVILGGFTSIAGVLIGAMAFGVATNVALSYVDSSLISTYTFLGVGLVLLLRPHGLFGRREGQVAEADIPPRPGAFQQWLRRTVVTKGRTSAQAATVRAVSPKTGLIVAAAVGVVLAVMPFTLDLQQLFVLTTALASFIGIAGLSLLVGHTGQVSLGHSGMLAIGGYTLALSAERGVPILLGLVCATVAGGLCGALLGAPTTRLTGLYLTVFTLVFSFAIPEIALRMDGLTGGPNGLAVTIPVWLSDERSMHWFVLAICGVVAAIVYLMSAGRIGRAWHAVRDSEDGARSIGLNPARTKLGAFVLGSALAGTSGALTVLLVGYVSPNNFGIFVAVYALLAVVLGGSTSLGGSLLGALFITLIPDMTGKAGVPQDLVFGAALVLILIFAPNGLAGLASKILRRLPRRLRDVPSVPVSVEPRKEAPETPSALQRADAMDSALLELRSVTAGYRAGSVIQDLSLSIREGEIVALLGTNGAGKSTTLRAISAVIGTTGGEILWQGQQLPATRTPVQSARLGLAHVPEGRGIFPDLTVIENLRMGSFSTPASTARWDAALHEVFTLFPILEERLQQQAGTLSGGQQQMLAIGRALISSPRLLILDEPSLGLSPVLGQQVFAALEQIAANGVAILLVEQNARAALRLADRAYVIQRGRVVLEGPAAEVANSESLEQSYIGASRDV
jgi:ABC-type branched-subunit amino acid transport system ATPase component/branched-subunit amino acid ABC-type transport system permease component